MRTAPEARHRASAFWQKALRFERAAEATSEQGLWDPAVANAVNALINAVDAVCVHYQGLRNASGAHHDALLLLSMGHGMDPRLRETIEKRLRALLSVKNLAQYDGRLLEESDAQASLGHLERAMAALRPFAAQNGWPPLAAPR